MTTIAWVLSIVITFPGWYGIPQTTETKVRFETEAACEAAKSTATGTARGMRTDVPKMEVACDPVAIRKGTK